MSKLQEARGVLGVFEQYKGPMHHSYPSEFSGAVRTLIAFVQSLDSPDALLQLLHDASAVIQSSAAKEAAKPLCDWLEQQVGVGHAKVILRASNGNLLVVELGATTNHDPIA